ncbi:unnamed protein product [Coffea canephora]|uniref:Uncharacterized protein n=1 Tax=Coffea canephora TaxID=49390 RepID=A0A068V804_COFCA|nr:unnamed protein product [Coffea canephora]
MVKLDDKANHPHISQACPPTDKATIAAYQNRHTNILENGISVLPHIDLLGHVSLGFKFHPSFKS